MIARTTRTALTVGVIYGGLQDMAGLARGRRISYVDFVKRQLGVDTTDRADGEGSITNAA